MKRHDLTKSAFLCVGMAFLLTRLRGADSPGAASSPAIPDSVGQVQADIREPLDPKKAPIYFDACREYGNRKYRERFAGRSPRAERDGVGMNALNLELVPFDSAASDKDGSWRPHGKFVGVIKNYAEGSYSAMNIVPASQTTNDPGVTCVWFGNDPNTDQLYLRLITRDTIVSLKAVRDSGHVHLKSYAEWREKTDSLLKVKASFENSLGELDLELLRATTPAQLAGLLHALWYTCDGGGCCKQQ